MKEVSAFLIIFTLIITFYIYYQSTYGSLTYVTSKIDNNKYLVRNENNKQESADKLAKLNSKIVYFINQLLSKYKSTDKYDSILRIKNKYNPNNISETLKNSNHTSYSVNKGEKIVLCIRQKEDDKYVDDNTMMFVIIHELGHIMSKSIGHTDEFWDNFKFLLQEAEKMNIYQKKNYNKKPQRYCGMDITDNPMID